jgi:hypothetical protein
MAKHKHSTYLVVLVTLMILFGLVVILDGCSNLIETDEGFYDSPDGMEVVDGDALPGEEESGDLAGMARRVARKTRSKPAYNEKGCYDTDNGIIPTVKGVVNNYPQFTDVCESSNHVQEWYCGKNGLPNYVSVACDAGLNCYDGACVEELLNTCDNGFLDDGEECDDPHTGSFCTDCVCDEGYIADPDNSACVEELVNTCKEGDLCDFDVDKLGVCKADGSCSSCTNILDNCPNGYNCEAHFCVKELDLCTDTDGVACVEFNKMFENDNWDGDATSTTYACELEGDSEAGNEYLNNPYRSGKVHLLGEPNIAVFDSTMDGSNLIEFFCDNGIIMQRTYNCPTDLGMSLNGAKYCQCETSDDCGFDWSCDSGVCEQ